MKGLKLEIFRPISSTRIPDQHCFITDSIAVVQCDVVLVIVILASVLLTKSAFLCTKVCMLGKVLNSHTVFDIDDSSASLIKNRVQQH